VRRAVRELEEIRKARPNDISVKSALAYYLCEYEINASRALALAREAFAGFPELRRGATRTEQEGYNKTKAVFLDALGWALYKNERFGEARQRFEEANRCDPERCDVWYHIALTNLEAGGALELAGTALEKANEFLPAVKAKPDQLGYPPERLERHIREAEKRLRAEIAEARKRLRVRPPGGRKPSSRRPGTPGVREAPRIPGEEDPALRVPPKAKERRLLEAPPIPGEEEPARRAPPAKDRKLREAPPGP